MKMAQERSAGVVVLKWSEEGWRFLALETDMTWKDGSSRLDLPKGHVERGEDWLEAAVRETEEEAGIDEASLDFTWGASYHDCEKPDKVSRMFIASTAARPTIRRNPVTRRKEHTGTLWVRLDDEATIARIHPYLRSCIEWARKVVSRDRLHSAHGSVSGRARDTSRG
jgi:8-oxo-dGTP pyrophosphatase MutT (NUDIX family)